MAMLGLFFSLAGSCGSAAPTCANGDCQAVDGGQSLDAGATTTGIPCEVAAVFDKCIGCHGSPPAAAPNSLVSRADLLVTSPRGGSVAERCLTRAKDSNNPMPPAATGMSLRPAEVAVLEKWVADGLPGGACQKTGSTQ
jgi:hypothetical protein